MRRALAAALILIAQGAAPALAEDADMAEATALAEIEACTLEDVGYETPETLWDCHSGAFSVCMVEADTSYGKMSRCYRLETRRIETLIERQITRLKIERRKNYRSLDPTRQTDSFGTLLDADQAAWESFRQSEVAFIRLSFNNLEADASAMTLTRKRYLRLRMIGYYYRLPEGLP
ncbi:MAG: hypothetical protein KDA56_15325 [Hyphomonas sp.]|nr:hypothetical protein [Hyphomonas sp.]